MVSLAFYMFGGGGLTIRGGMHCFCLQAADLPSDQFLDIGSKLGPSPESQQPSPLRQPAGSLYFLTPLRQRPEQSSGT